MSTVETNKAIGQIWIYRFDRFHEICSFLLRFTRFLDFLRLFKIHFMRFVY